jgi:hypothetical protein
MSHNSDRRVLVLGSGEGACRCHRRRRCHWHNVRCTLCPDGPRYFARCDRKKPACNKKRASTAMAVGSAPSCPAAAHATAQPCRPGRTGGTAASALALAGGPAAGLCGLAGAAYRSWPLSVVRRARTSAAARSPAAARLRGRSTLPFLPTLNRDFFLEPMRTRCQATGARAACSAMSSARPRPAASSAGPP